ncbi:TonB-linked SusC/RagA family outer membrane protein [Marinoscillum furvescens DSM 4134]|uniref:TonB-linked SusC/RagA family outer membrane protein n=2 Tax=Marinoscillum furvescens TaxID=1026 RepID=A0A3D9L5U4_MARFU|nr:TonB-linked SusC/RagA family outer membrane protein [Marinoscillum furvescens DSM 4134]
MIMKATLRFGVLLVGMMYSMCVIAQERMLTGTVTDDQGNELPGAAVQIKGTGTGTVTDIDGNYKLNVSSGDQVLVISFVGFQNKEIPVGSKSVINVELSQDLQTLGEVVVVGYGTQTRRDLTGAISSIDAKAIEDKPLASLEQALEGRLSGVVVRQNSGQPGGGISVRIRGITSLNGNNEPLYVVDGVPLEANQNNETANFSNLGGGSGQTRVSALSTLNPSDIESIEVLKDASAAAIYGSRAANGVVLITTKKGKQGQSKISYEGYYGVQQTSKMLDMMNLREYAEYQNDIRPQVGWDPSLEHSRPERLGEGTNWQEEIFRVAPVQSHQISVSGGNESTTYYSSMNFFDQDGIVLNTDFQRFSFRINVSHKVNDWFKIGNSVNISKSKEHVTLTDASDGIIAGALRAAPDIPVAYSDGGWGGPTIVEGTGGINNPVAWSEIRNTTFDRKKILGNTYAEINILKGLKWRSELGYDFNVNNSGVFNPMHEIGNGNEIATSIRKSVNNTYWQLKNYLTYDQQFGQHKLTVMGGHEMQQNEYRWIDGTVRGHLTNDIQELSAGDQTTATNGGGVAYWGMMSYFGRVNYTFKNRYLFTGTVRADGSSNFDIGNKWGVFPSFSAGWVLSEENFFPSNGAFNWMKIRAGYGETGNQNVGGYAYGALLRNIPSSYGPALLQDNIPNPNLSWETMVSYNLGVELGFLNDRLKLDVDLFKKVSSDFLLVVPSMDYYGAISPFDWLGLNPATINAGEMQNQGVDLSLKTVNIDKNGLRWNTNVVFSHYRNELTSMPNGVASIKETFEWSNVLTQTDVGQPLGQFWGYKVDKLFTSEEEVRNAPYQGEVGPEGTWMGDIKWQNINGDSVINGEDKTYIGNPHPLFTFGFGNDVKFRNFDLSIFVNGSYGNDIYNWNRHYTEGMAQVISNVSTVVKDRYTAENTDTNVPRYVQGDPNGNATEISDRFVEDGSYLRIQNVTIGYTLPAPVINRLNITRLRVYATFQNLYTFTRYSGFDPAIGSYNQNARLTGLDPGRYPVPRIMQLGLNLNF